MVSMTFSGLGGLSIFVLPNLQLLEYGHGIVGHIPSKPLWPARVQHLQNDLVGGGWFFEGHAYCQGRTVLPKWSG